MHDILTQHLALLCTFYKVRHLSDLRKIPFKASAKCLREVERDLEGTRFFKIVEQHSWPSAAATLFHLWPADKKLVGIKLVVSRIAPFFYTDWLYREGWESSLDFNLPSVRQIIESKVNQRYVAALKKPIPNEAQRLRDKVLPIVAAKGFICVSQYELNRCPSGKSVPRFLRSRHINFFYFHSIPLAGPVWSKKLIRGERPGLEGVE